MRSVDVVVEDRSWVVDPRADPALAEFSRQLPSADARVVGECDRVLMEDMGSAVWDLREVNGVEVAEAGRQRSGVALALFGDAIEPVELSNPDGSLQVRHPVVVAGGDVVVASSHTLIAEHADAICDGLVVGRHDAAFAGHDVLGCIEREASDAPRADRLPGHLGADRLCGVFNHGQAVAFGEVANRHHVGRKAVEVDRHDCLGAWSDEGGNGFGVHVVVVADVGEACRGSGFEDGVEGRNEGERGCYDLVTRLEVERFQRHDEGSGA